MSRNRTSTIRTTVTITGGDRGRRVVRSDQERTLTGALFFLPIDGAIDETCLQVDRPHPGGGAAGGCAARGPYLVFQAAARGLALHAGLCAVRTRQSGVAHAVAPARAAWTARA